MRPRLVVPLLAIVLFTAWVFGGPKWSPSYTELARRRDELASLRTTANLQVALVRTSASKRSQAFRLRGHVGRRRDQRSQKCHTFGCEKREPFFRPLSIQVMKLPLQKAARWSGSMRMSPSPVGSPLTRMSWLSWATRFDTAIAASVVYNACEVVYFANSNTAPALTNDKMPFVFRVSPSDDDIMQPWSSSSPGSPKRKKEVHILLLYPKSKTRPAQDDPAKRLEASAAKLITDKPIDFMVDELAYDEDSLDEVLRSSLPRLLSQSRGKFNVVMIADVSLVAAMLQDRIEEIWADRP